MTEYELKMWQQDLDMITKLSEEKEGKNMKENKMYKERMLIEFEELVTKIANAKNYIDEEMTEENDLLIRQIEAMLDYKNILAQRILKEMGLY